MFHLVLHVCALSILLPYQSHDAHSSSLLFANYYPLSKPFFHFWHTPTNKQSGSPSGRRGLKAGTKTKTARRRLCVKADEVIEADEESSPSGKGKAGKSGSRRRERELSGKGKGGSKGTTADIKGRFDDSCLCIEEIDTRVPAVSPSGKGKAGKSGSAGMDINGRVDADDAVSSSGKSGKSRNSRRERRLSGKGKGGKVSIQ